MINWSVLLITHEINYLSDHLCCWGLGIGDWAQSPIPNPQTVNGLIFIIMKLIKATILFIAILSLSYTRKLKQSQYLEKDVQFVWRSKGWLSLGKPDDFNKDKFKFCYISNSVNSSENFCMGHFDNVVIKGSKIILENKQNTIILEKFEEFKDTNSPCDLVYMLSKRIFANNQAYSISKSKYKASKEVIKNFPNKIQIVNLYSEFANQPKDMLLAHRLRCFIEHSSQQDSLNKSQGIYEFLKQRFENNSEEIISKPAKDLLVKFTSENNQIETRLIPLLYSKNIIKRELAKKKGCYLNK